MKNIPLLILTILLLSVTHNLAAQTFTANSELVEKLQTHISKKVERVELSGNTVRVIYSNATLPSHITPAYFEEIVEYTTNALSSYKPSLRHFDVLFEDKQGIPRKPEYFLPQIKITPSQMLSQNQKIAIRPRYVWQGALSGKQIFISPGHGWYYADSGSWLTQRPDTNGILEDFLTATIVNKHLLPYLETTGAKAISVRERDTNTAEAIIDNQDALYSETGSWADGSSAGGWNSSTGSPYRHALTTTTATASAKFTPQLSKPGWLAVYTWYVAGSNRPTDAEFIIHHSGGNTAFSVNQEVNGSRWNYLGIFYFEPGNNQGVEVTNKSTQEGEHVIADAIKFGGGMGSIIRGSSTSGKPRWQECSRYWAIFNSAPADVYDIAGYEDNSDDVTCRPKFSEWWGGGDAYISVHTNAFDGVSTGTETYVYTDKTPAGSEELMNKVHDQVVSDIRAKWDSDWVDRGKKTGNYGEVRAAETMPAILLELAFHDGTNGVPDNEYLRSPRFRRLCGKAIARGLIKYFNPSSPLPPDEVTTLTLKNTATGLQAVWAPVDGSTEYAVYIARGGRGFADPIRTSGTNYSIENVSPGETVYVSVASANAGGESYKSRIVGARRSYSANPVYRVIVVDGFERWDYNADETVNTFDYSIEHIEAIPSGVAVDGALNTAIETLAPLADYQSAIYLLGEESTQDETFSSTEQTIVKNYLESGGSLFVSGSELAWDLDEKGTSQDRSFIHEVLKSAYSADECGCFSASATSGSPFDGMGAINFSDGTQGAYKVTYADILSPQNGGQIALDYGSNRAGAISYSGTYRLITMGFPFETITDSVTRTELMKRALAFLIGYDPAKVEPIGGEDAGTPDAGEDTGTPDTGEEDAQPVDTGSEDGSEDTGDGSEDATKDATEDAAEDTGESDTVEAPDSPDTETEDTEGEDTTEEDVTNDDASQDAEQQEDSGIVNDSGENTGDSGEVDDSSEEWDNPSSEEDASSYKPPPDSTVTEKEEESGCGCKIK